MGSPVQSRTFAAAVVLGISAMLLPSAQAQFWDWGNRPQRQQQREFNPFGGFFHPRWEGPRFDSGPREREAPVDYSHAPAPSQKKPEATTPIVVVGDANADWLAYGLEDAFSESPEIAVVRKQRTDSGLIRYGGRGDIEWPQAAREIIAAEKPKFIVMMIGNNDRQPIREKAPPTAKTSAPKAQAQPGQPAPAATSTPPPQAVDPELQQAEEPETPEAPPANLTPEQARQAAFGPWEFHTEKWERAYVRRIDATIAVLKSAGVPVFWVGLPSQRGPKASSDSSYLNELYRSRAEKAGIVYVDIWDGFVDESGRFSPQGPDYEGQIRRLRTGDGVYFTKFGARKLAHYVEREIQRHLSNRALPMALPIPDDAGSQGPGAKPGSAAQRPVAGPVLPLTSAKIVPEELIGGRSSPRPSTPDPTAARVLTKGEPIAATSGRADDFSWPRGGALTTPAQPVAAAPAGAPSGAPAESPPAQPAAGKPAKPAKAAPHAGDGAQRAPTTADARPDHAGGAASSAEEKPQPQRRPRSNVPRPPLPIFQGFFR
ncbi:MAG TPA: DUF459 domain-containing protein [Xanthobacteraceae bacterium]